MPEYVTTSKHQRIKVSDALLDWFNEHKYRTENAISFLTYWGQVNPDDAVLCDLTIAVLEGKERVNGGGESLAGISRGLVPDSSGTGS